LLSGLRRVPALRRPGLLHRALRRPPRPARLVAADLPRRPHRAALRAADRAGARLARRQRPARRRRCPGTGRRGGDRPRTVRAAGPSGRTRSRPAGATLIESPSNGAKKMPRRSRLLLALATATAACALAPPHIAVEPDATFAAHQEHRGLVIDRLAGGRTATLGPAGWIRLPRPTFVLDADGERIAALWLSGERVVVRRTSSETSPVVAEITPGWED